MRILLAKRRALGDSVLLLSTLENLAGALPGAELHVLVPEPFAGLFEGQPAVRSVLSYGQSFLPLVKRLRALRLDHFVQLHSSPGSRLLAALSGAGRVSHSVQNSKTERAYGRHPHALEWDSFFLRTLFGPSVRLPAPIPRIRLSAPEREEGQAFWRSLGAEPSSVVFFGLGASRPSKRWPPAHFARLAELLRERHGLLPALITGPGEEEARFSGEVLDAFRARGLRGPGSGGRGDFLHVSGLGLRRLCRAVSAVRAYVGNDSGPKHVAVALGIPSFTFFGPEDPGEWHPYSREEHPLFFLPGLACRREDSGRWCGLERCTEERHRCMAGLEPLDALAVITRRLGL